MDFSLEYTNIWQKSPDFCFAYFFLKFLEYNGGIDFPMDFWLFLMCFINVLFKVITNLKFYNRCFIKDNLQKHFCIKGWCLVRQRNS